MPQGSSLPRRGRVAAEGGRVGASFSQNSIDCLQNACEISIDIVVPEPKDTKSIACENFVPADVACAMGSQVMLAAVKLDDESMPHAHEVKDVAAMR